MPNNVPEPKEPWGHWIKRHFMERWFRLLDIHGRITLNFTTDGKMVMRRRMSYSTPNATLQYVLELHEAIVKMITMINTMSEHGVKFQDLQILQNSPCATCPGAEFAYVPARPVEEPLPPPVDLNAPVTLENLTKGVKF